VDVPGESLHSRVVSPALSVIADGRAPDRPAGLHIPEPARLPHLRDVRATQGQDLQGRKRNTAREPERPTTLSQDSYDATLCQPASAAGAGSASQGPGGGRASNVVCPRCTFENDPSTLSCEMCDKVLQPHWDCPVSHRLKRCRRTRDNA
jgi:hypothetical protein